MTGRKTVEFDDAPDEARVAAYQQRIAAARQRTQVGGAPPLEGTPNLVEAAEQAKSPQLPEQDRAYQPDELRNLIEQGRAVPGVGAGIPAAQAASLGEAPTVGLRQETVDGLKALEEQAQAAQASQKPAAEPPEGAAEEGDSTQLDPEFMQALMGGYTDKLQRKERRDAIEARVGPVDLRDFLFGSGGTQTVSVIPDVFEADYRLISGQEDLFAKRYAWSLCQKAGTGKDKETSQAFYDTVTGLVNVVLSVQAVNGEDIPDHRQPDGTVDEDTFTGKFTDFCNRPFLVLQDMWVNFTWFNERVRDQIDVESLGNG
tara:strand:+ start:803 stop:1747 length:945 start_codon:yes stop_codon:yes gene_type:complete